MKCGFKGRFALNVLLLLLSSDVEEGHILVKIAGKKKSFRYSLKRGKNGEVP